MEEEPHSEDGDEGSSSNNYRRPPQKNRTHRTRVSRACDRCRTKKDKCDGGRPSCSACVAAGQDCSYDPSTKKRGLPEGYVRGLEKLFAVAVTKIQGLEGTLVGLMGRDEVLRIWNHERFGDELHETWKQSTIQKGLESLLIKLESSDYTGGKRKHDSQTTNFAKDKQAWEYHIQDGTRSNGLSFGSQVQNFIGRETGEQQSNGKRPKRTLAEGINMSAEERPRIAPPPQASQLVDLYFSHTQNWLPIIERHDILRLLYQYEESPETIDHTGPEGPRTGSHATLWAILAYAQHQESAIVSPQTSGLSEEYYQIAKDLVPDTGFQVGHVQALLLLAMVNIGLGNWSEAWHLCGRAVRIAIDLELGHQKSKAENGNKGTKVFLGCFILDTHISARLQRCPHLRRKDVEVLEFTVEDGPEEWDPWLNSLQGRLKGQAFPESTSRRRPVQALSCFNRLVEMYGILNDIIRDTSTGSDRESFCQTQMMKIDSWREKLPKSYRGLFEIRPAASQGHRPIELPHQIYLYLVYLMVLADLNFHSHPNTHAFETPDRRPPPSFTKLPSMTLKTMEDLNSGLPVQILPPVLEFAVHLAVGSALISRGNFGSSEFPEPFVSYSTRMTTLVSPLEKAWPVFTPIKKTLEENTPPLPFLGSETGNGASSSPVLSRIPTHDSMERGFLSSNLPFGFGATQAQPVVHPRGVSRKNHEVGPELDLTRLAGDLGPTSFGEPAGRIHSDPYQAGLQRVYSSTWNGGTQDAMSALSSSLADTNSRGFDVDMAELAPDLHPDPSMPPTVDAISIPYDPDLDSNFGTSMGDDVDAIFRDLAHLDTTDWTNDREQGLKDFGFADENTFQEFCRDPERLVSNNALPHPLSNTATDFWPPPGFFPGHFSTAGAQVETSQISHPFPDAEQIPAIPDSVGW